LPLSVQQEREIIHFIEARQRAGEAWDTPELAALIRDMLNPPELGDEDSLALADTETERFTALHEEPSDDEREHDVGGAP
jgi:hypothetical protein